MFTIVSASCLTMRIKSCFQTATLSKENAKQNMGNIISRKKNINHIVHDIFSNFPNDCCWLNFIKQNIMTDCLCGTVVRILTLSAMLENYGEVSTLTWLFTGIIIQVKTTWFWLKWCLSCSIVIKITLPFNDRARNNNKKECLQIMLHEFTFMFFNFHFLG